MGSFSIWHWLVVLVIVILIFGTKKLKTLGSDLGEAIKNFKTGMKDEGEKAAAGGAPAAPAETRVEPVAEARLLSAQAPEAPQPATTVAPKARTKAKAKAKSKARRAPRRKSETP